MSDNPIQTLTMPKWGLSMKEGKVAQWLVEEGATFETGAELVDIETEKISSAAEATAGGLLRRRVAQEGDVVPVSGLLGVIAEAAVPDADIDAFVEDFLANFVPPEDDDEDTGPATETVEIDGKPVRYLVKGEGGRARHPDPWLRRRPEQLAVQSRRAGCGSNGLRARSAGPRRLVQGDRGRQHRRHG